MVTLSRLTSSSWSGRNNKVLAIWNKVKLTWQPKYAWWLIVLMGILLRLRQYLVNRSLWFDEAYLALNIVHRSFVELTVPLDGNQGAPVGFLLIEKLILVILGNKDYILRIFPLICGIIGMYLMYQIARVFSKKLGLFSLFMFAISSPLIYYSSELKQYQIDVAVALSLVYISLHCIKNNARNREFLLLTIAGIAGMWLSHPSVFILAGIGMLLASNILRKRLQYSIFRLIWIGIIWIFNLWIIYSLSVWQLAANDYLQAFWADNFLPLPVWEHWDWLGLAFEYLLNAITGIFWPQPVYFLALYSIIILVGVMPSENRIENQFITGLAIILIPLTLIASSLHLYPVKGRFLLFLAPFIFLLMANGVQNVFRFLGKRNWKISKSVCFLILIGVTVQPALLTAENVMSPPLGEHIKPVLEYIHKNKQPNDIIYVYYGGEAAFEYYNLSFNFDSSNTVIGVESQNDPTKYKDDIKNLKGHDRVWFIFSHNCDRCAVHEQKYYIEYLNNIGTVMDKLFESSVNMYLYDLNP